MPHKHLCVQNIWQRFQLIDQGNKKEEQILAFVKGIHQPSVGGFPTQIESNAAMFYGMTSSYPFFYLLETTNG